MQFGLEPLNIVPHVLIHTSSSFSHGRIVECMFAFFIFKVNCASLGDVRGKTKPLPSKTEQYHVYEMSTVQRPRYPLVLDQVLQQMQTLFLSSYC